MMWFECSSTVFVLSLEQTLLLDHKQKLQIAAASEHFQGILTLPAACCASVEYDVQQKTQ